MWKDILNFVSKQIVSITIVQIVTALFLYFSLHKQIFSAFSGIKKKTWMALFGIVFLGFMVCVFFMSTFQFGPFLEDTACLAKEIAGGDSSGYANYRYGIVYPLILSWLFRFFGVNLSLATILNSALFLFNIVLIFIFSYMYLEDELASLISSVTYAINPLVLNYVLNLSNDFVIFSTFTLLFLISIFLLRQISNLRMVLLSLLSLSLLVNVRAQMMVFIIPFVGFLFIHKHILKLKQPKNLIIFLPIVFLLLITFSEKSTYIASKIYNLDFIRPKGENVILPSSDFFNKLYPELSIYFVKNNFKALLKSYPLFWLFLIQVFLLINSRRSRELFYLVVAQILITLGYLLHGAYYSRGDYQDLNVLLILLLFIPWIGFGLKIFMHRILPKKLSYFTKILFTGFALLILSGIYFDPTKSFFKLKYSVKVYKNTPSEYSKDYLFFERLKAKLQSYFKIKKITFCFINVDYIKSRQWKLFSKDNTYFETIYSISNHLASFDSYFKSLPEDKSKYYNNSFFDLTKSKIWRIEPKPIFIFIFSERDINKQNSRYAAEQTKFMINSVLVKNNANFLFDFEDYSVYLLQPREHFK